MTYKGYRIDRKCNIFDLDGNLIMEKAGNVEIAKEEIDKRLEKEHKKKEEKEKKG